MPLLTLPRSFQVNSAGAPYGLAKLYTYRAGTTTNLQTYKTSSLGGGASHTNPIVADANGLFPAIYIDTDSGYDLRVILKTSADVTIYDEDNIPRSTTSLLASTFADSITVSGSEPRIILNETDGGANVKKYDIDVNGSVLAIRTRTDADGTGKDVLVVARTGTTVSSMQYGNATDNPAHTFAGAVQFNQAINVLSTITSSSTFISAASTLNTSTEVALTGVAAVKTALTARSNTATLANDAHLIITINQVGTYDIEVDLIYTEASAGAAGIKYALSFTGTTTYFAYNSFSYNNGASSSFADVVLPSISVATIGTGTSTTRISGRLTAGTTGTLSVQWSQYTSNANATTMHRNSCIKATRVL